METYDKMYISLHRNKLLMEDHIKILPQSMCISKQDRAKHRMQMTLLQEEDNVNKSIPTKQGLFKNTGQ